MKVSTLISCWDVTDGSENDTKKCNTYKKNPNRLTWNKRVVPGGETNGRTAAIARSDSALVSKHISLFNGLIS